MASGTFRQVYVRCPFYRFDEVKKINCEGIAAGSSFTTTYKRKTDCDQQMDLFCCGKYENCEICRMLMDAKYREDEK